MQLRHFYAKRRFFMLQPNFRSDILINFWAASFSLVCVDHPTGLKGKDVHLVETNLGLFFLDGFPSRKDIIIYI